MLLAKLSKFQHTIILSSPIYFLLFHLTYILISSSSSSITMYQSELLLSSDRKWRVIGSNSVRGSSGEVWKEAGSAVGIVSFLRRKVGKSREPVFERLATPSSQLPNNFNFHAKFAGCGPIVAFPPCIERRFRVEKWPRISRREGARDRERKLNFSGILSSFYACSCYTLIFIQIFRVILSLPLICKIFNVFF